MTFKRDFEHTSKRSKRNRLTQLETTKLIVKGTTKLVGLVGHPIAQVRSPTLFNEWFEKNDLDCVMVPIDLLPNCVPEFDKVLRSWENLIGCLVTIPVKSALADCMDTLGDRAARLGAINVLRRDPDGKLHGETLDGVGLVDAVCDNGVQVQGANVLVIGAGGAGRAIADAYCERGVAKITVIDQAQDKAEQLLEIIGRYFPLVECSSRLKNMTEYDVVTNASPVGMHPDPNLPIQEQLLSQLRPNAYVADVITEPKMTPFLLAAQYRGLRTQDGQQMSQALLGPLRNFLGF